MKNKLKIKKNDKVKVIAGDDKGQEGRVLKVVTDKNRIIVEGVNLISKHTKPNATNPQGGIIKKEAPIHISNVLILDKQGNPTRVGKEVVNEKLVRYSKKSGEVIE